MMELVVIVFAVLLGLIPASIAQSKGHDFFPWWIFGALLFIVALPCALLVKSQLRTDQQVCGACRSTVPSEATICAHCRTPLDGGGAVTTPPRPPVKTDWRIIGITAGIVGAFLVVIVIANL